MIGGWVDHVDCMRHADEQAEEGNEWGSEWEE